jgi:hypothetical protein
LDVEPAVRGVAGKLRHHDRKHYALEDGTIGETPKAIRFPVDRGYVTVSKMIEEGVGAFQGPITVGGAIYRVFLANSGDDKPVEYEYDDGVATLAR